MGLRRAWAEGTQRTHRFASSSGRVPPRTHLLSDVLFTSSWTARPSQKATTSALLRIPVRDRRHHAPAQQLSSYQELPCEAHGVLASLLLLLLSPYSFLSLVSQEYYDDHREKSFRLERTVFLAHESLSMERARIDKKRGLCHWASGD